jgi:WD40 repeat protein
MIAATQRGRPISLFDNQGQLLGYCERDSEATLEHETRFAPLWLCDLVFSSDTTVNYLAALYHDGTLILLNTWGTEIAQTSTGAHVLARSPTDRALENGSVDGTLQIVEPESLNLIYKIVTNEYPIKSLTFTPDGRRILDSRGNQCNIW